MPDRTTLGKFPVYDGLIKGAQNAIRQCLSVTNEDVVTLVCDRTSLDAAAALTRAVEATGAEYSIYILENHAARPAVKLPEAILESIRASTVSIYGVKPHQGEYQHRFDLVKLVQSAGIRHAHVLGMNANTLQIGMAADYNKIAKLNKLLMDKLQQTRAIYVRSFSGTELKLTVNYGVGMESSDGIITPEKWDNLPNGEVVFAPQKIEGTFVCDGHLPLDIEVKRTELQRKAVRLTFANDRLIHIEGGPAEEGKKIQGIIDGGKNLDRASGLIIGSNFAIKAWSGNPTFDGHAPGAHIVLGDNNSLPKLPWKADEELHFHCRRTGVLFDDEPIITYGKFEQGILDQL